MAFGRHIFVLLLFSGVFSFLFMYELRIFYVRDTQFSFVIKGDEENEEMCFECGNYSSSASSIVEYSVRVIKDRILSI